MPVLILLQSRGIKASCIISGDRTTRVSLSHKQRKPRRWPVDMASDYGKILNNRGNQSVLKAHPEEFTTGHLSK